MAEECLKIKKVVFTFYNLPAKGSKGNAFFTRAPLVLCLSTSLIFLPRAYFGRDSSSCEESPKNLLGQAGLGRAGLWRGWPT